MRPFRFGVLHMSPVTDGAAWLDSVRAVEAAGYSTVLLSDHFEHSPLAPIPALAAAVSATNTLRLGSLVLANDFRHPAVLAKELTTIDISSSGRLEVGLGAGWMVGDYDQTGIDLQSAPPRIDRFDRLELHLQIYLAAITHTPQKVAEHWCEQLGFVIDMDELLGSPHVLIGSFGDLEAKIQRLRKQWGFSYLSFYDTAAQEMRPLVRHMAEAST